MLKIRPWIVLLLLSICLFRFNMGQSLSCKILLQPNLRKPFKSREVKEFKLSGDFYNTIYLQIESLKQEVADLKASLIEYSIISQKKDSSLSKTLKFLDFFENNFLQELSRKNHELYQEHLFYDLKFDKKQKLKHYFFYVYVHSIHLPTLIKQMRFFIPKTLMKNDFQYSEPYSFAFPIYKNYLKKYTNNKEVSIETSFEKAFKKEFYPELLDYPFALNLAYFPTGLSFSSLNWLFAKKRTVAVAVPNSLKIIHGENTSPFNNFRHDAYSHRQLLELTLSKTYKIRFRKYGISIAEFLKTFSTFNTEILTLIDSLPSKKEIYHYYYFIYTHEMLGVFYPNKNKELPHPYSRLKENDDHGYYYNFYASDHPYSGPGKPSFEGFLEFLNLINSLEKR